MSDDVNLNAYFERIGFAGSIAPTLQTLETLHALQPAAIPFENLNPLLDLPVPLDQPSLEQKLLHDRRGGYCFEQNLLFLRVLRDLGFAVRGLAARVLWGHPEGSIRRRSHMLIAVDIAGSTYLADVGFGAQTPTAPIKLKADVEQPTPHEPFRVVGENAPYRLELRLGEDWRALYAVDFTEQYELDYEHANYYLSTHPQSQFRQTLIAARAEKGGRSALRGNRLTTRQTGAESERRVLASVAEIKDVLTGVFGINLPSSDRLDPALQRVLETAETLVD